MTITTDTATLTKDDITAIRRADSAVFRIHQGRATLELGVSKWADDRGHVVWNVADQTLFPEIPDFVSDGRERRRVIEVLGTLTGSSDDTSTRPLSDGSSAFYMLHSAKYHHPWLTWAQMLVKPGDVVVLSFYADAHTNDYARHAGLHVDTLTVYLRRTGQKCPIAFSMGESITPDNSARMVKRS